MATYRVKAGDTLGKIAKRFYGDPARFTLIVTANTLPNPDRLTVGQELVIPDLPTPGPVVPTPPPPPPPPPPPTAAASRMAQLNVQRLSRLHPIVAVRGHSMLELCAHGGLAVLVTQGLRTWEEQDQLYAQGRTAPGDIVTKAKGGESFHNYGLAFDIVVLDAIGKMDWDSTHPGWTQAAQLGKSAGLEWGGDWVGFKDRPHFQYTGGLKIADCKALYDTAGGIAAVWEKVR
jgi:D-alanyl-D-alanine carboxypeptidase-like protein/LysM domain-containing protein